MLFGECERGNDVVRLTSERLKELLEKPAIKARNPGLVTVGAVVREQDPQPALVKDVPREQNDFFHYLHEVDESSVICRGIHHGEPVAKQRPRFANGHVYTPITTKQHQAALLECVRSSIPTKSDRVSAFGIRVVFCRRTHHRKDVDNLLKCVLDAFNKQIFYDDCQVKEIMAWSIVDSKTPRTEFVVYRLGIIDKTKGYCANCGREFPLYDSWKARLYCSRRCMALKTSKKVITKCSSCGKEILRIPSQIKPVNYCSTHCRSEATVAKLSCQQCGASFVRPQSQVKDSHFCSKKCYNLSRFGKHLPLTPQQLTDRAKRAWVKRRLNLEKSEVRTDGEPGTLVVVQSSKANQS